MRRLLGEQFFVILLVLVGSAGLLVAVALAVQERSWVASSGDVISGVGWLQALTVGGGVAWFALFCGVALCLELLIELVRREPHS